MKWGCKQGRCGSGDLPRFFCGRLPGCGKNPRRSTHERRGDEGSAEAGRYLVLLSGPAGSETHNVYQGAQVALLLHRWDPPAALPVIQTLSRRFVEQTTNPRPGGPWPSASGGRPAQRDATERRDRYRHRKLPTTPAGLRSADRPAASAPGR